MAFDCRVFEHFAKVLADFSAWKTSSRMSVLTLGRVDVRIQPWWLPRCSVFGHFAKVMGSFHSNCRTIRPEVGRRSALDGEVGGLENWSLGESAFEWWQDATSGGGCHLGTAFTEISLEVYLRGSSTEWRSRLWLLGLSGFHGQRVGPGPLPHGLLALVSEVEVRRPGLSLWVQTFQRYRTGFLTFRPAHPLPWGRGVGALPLPQSHLQRPLNGAWSSASTWRSDALGPATFKLSRTAVDSTKTKRAKKSFPCRMCEHNESPSSSVQWKRSWTCPQHATGGRCRANSGADGRHVRSTSARRRSSIKFELTQQGVKTQDPAANSGTNCERTWWVQSETTTTEDLEGRSRTRSLSAWSRLRSPSSWRRAMPSANSEAYTARVEVEQPKYFKKFVRRKKPIIQEKVQMIQKIRKIRESHLPCKRECERKVRRARLVNPEIHKAHGQEKSRVRRSDVEPACHWEFASLWKDSCHWSLESTTSVIHGRSFKVKSPGRPATVRESSRQPCQCKVTNTIVWAHTKSKRTSF